MQLSPVVILSVIGLYFLILIIMAYFTSRNARQDDFFIAGRKSPWYLVAFGMIGASLSGVTFLSIPGVVGTSGLNTGFSYLQVVLGYLVGYLVIARVLMPTYYRMNLTSIYTYLESRFGVASYKTGAFFFLVSRTIGASFRLFLATLILHEFVFSKPPFNVPFFATVLITIALIWTYTFKGGIKTIVWTDTFQTAAMLAAVVMTVVSIGNQMSVPALNLPSLIAESSYSKVFFFEGGWSDPNNFFKQFLSGAAITIVMTGLDQDMMQKNLSCRNIKEAQLNMFWFSILLFFVNLIFMGLGALLYIYADFAQIGLPERADTVFATIALHHLPPSLGLVFVIGLVAAAYSSADSALTALTTSFCVDFLGVKTDGNVENPFLHRIVHIGFSALMFFVILLFWYINDTSVINKLFTIAGYTYGPLLGLYAFGFTTRRRVRDGWVPVISVAAPILTFIVNTNSIAWLNGYKFGFELLILNGLFSFLGLWALSFSPARKVA